MWGPSLIATERLIKCADAVDFVGATARTLHTLGAPLRRLNQVHAGIADCNCVACAEAAPRLCCRLCGSATARAPALWR